MLIAHDFLAVGADRAPLPSWRSSASAADGAVGFGGKCICMDGLLQNLVQPLEFMRVLLMLRLRSALWPVFLETACTARCFSVERTPLMSWTRHQPLCMLVL